MSTQIYKNKGLRNRTKKYNKNKEALSQTLMSKSRLEVLDFIISKKLPKRRCNETIDAIIEFAGIEKDDSGNFLNIDNSFSYIFT